MPLNQARDIVLSAKRASWRMLDHHADESDKRYANIRSSILERDKHTCVFCGFQSSKFQEIHHLDDNHGHNQPENLVTACPLCHLCFHLGMAGLKDSGTIIWCPELTQIQINTLARTIFIAISNRGKFEDSARKLYEQLESRASIIKEELGDGAINPGSIGQAFLEMTEEQYNSRAERFPGLRMLPKMAAFSKQIAFWQTDTSSYGAIVEADWAKLLPATEPLSSEVN